MLALDPAQTFEARVKSDAEAVFRFRFLTGREYLGALEIEKRRGASEVFDPEVTRAVYAALRVNLVGWEGVKRVDAEGAWEYLDYDGGGLEDVTTAAEAWALFYSSLQTGRLSVPEKNGSGSPSDSSLESSAAEDAGPDGAATE